MTVPAPPPLPLQLVPLALYFALVAALPAFSDSSGNVLLLVVGGIRFLLLWPFVLPAVMRRTGWDAGAGRGKKVRVGDALGAYKAVFWFVGGCSVVLGVWQGGVALRERGGKVVGVVGAVDERPAVRALGWDFLIGMVGWGVWIWCR